MTVFSYGTIIFIYIYNSWCYLQPDVWKRKSFHPVPVPKRLLTLYWRKLIFRHNSLAPTKKCSYLSSQIKLVFLKTFQQARYYQLGPKHLTFIIWQPIIDDIKRFLIKTIKVTTWLYEMICPTTPWIMWPNVLQIRLHMTLS